MKRSPNEKRSLFFRSKISDLTDLLYRAEEILYKQFISFFFEKSECGGIVMWSNESALLCFEGDGRDVSITIVKELCNLPVPVCELYARFARRRDKSSNSKLVAVAGKSRIYRGGKTLPTTSPHFPDLCPANLWFFSNDQIIIKCLWNWQ